MILMHNVFILGISIITATDTFIILHQDPPIPLGSTMYLSSVGRTQVMQ